MLISAVFSILGDLGAIGTRLILLSPDHYERKDVARITVVSFQRLTGITRMRTEVSYWRSYNVIFEEISSWKINKKRATNKSKNL